MYQVFRDSANTGRFLWIRDLAKPDLALALIVGLTTALLMAANPDLPEQMRLLLIALPAIVAVITALKLCSALAVYFAASNCFSAAQTYFLHALVARRVKSGALVI
jgi:YidC/Oxa1 family membrane protein insertase